MGHTECGCRPQVDGGVDHVHRLGRDDDLLGEGTDHRGPGDAIAHGHPFHAGPHQTHMTGEFAPRRERNRHMDLVLVGDEQDVGEVGGGRHDVDDHLALTRHGVRKVFHHQGLGGAVFVAAERAHDRVG